MCITSIIDGVTSFLQLKHIQYTNIRGAVQTRVTGNSNTVHDGGIVIGSEGFDRIYVCV